MSKNSLPSCLFTDYLSFTSNLMCEYNHLIVCTAGAPTDFGLESVPTQHRPDRATTKDLGPQSTCVVKHGQETMFGHTKTGGNKSGAVNYEKTSLDEICSMLGVEHKQVAQVPAHLGVKHRTWQGHRFSTWCLHNPK